MTGLNVNVAVVGLPDLGFGAGFVAVAFDLVVDFAVVGFAVVVVVGFDRCRSTFSIYHLYLFIYLFCTYTFQF